MATIPVPVSPGALNGVPLLVLLSGRHDLLSDASSQPLSLPPLIGQAYTHRALRRFGGGN